MTNTAATSGVTLNLPNLAADTYYVLIYPATPVTTVLQAAFYAGAAGSLPANGSVNNFGTSAPGQYAYLTFAGTAGQNIDLALTNLSLTPTAGGVMSIYIYEPNGTLMAAWNCTPSSAGCLEPFYNLPLTGIYSLTVKPVTASQTMSFTATLSTDTTGTLVLNTPAGITMSQTGQAAVLSFTATAGQTVGLNVASISTTPANATLQINVYHSNGTFLTDTTTVSGTTLNLSNLPADTYNALIFPLTPVTTSMQVTIH